MSKCLQTGVRWQKRCRKGLFRSWWLCCSGRRGAVRSIQTATGPELQSHTLSPTAAQSRCKQENRRGEAKWQLLQENLSVNEIYCYLRDSLWQLAGVYLGSPHNLSKADIFCYTRFLGRWGVKIKRSDNGAQISSISCADLEDTPMHIETSI